MVIDKDKKKEIIFILISLIAYLSLSIILIYHHEFSSDEVHSWLIGLDSSNIKEFIGNFRDNEGHPVLWTFILYIVSHIFSSNVETMKIIHIAISTSTAFLILKFFPFNKIFRVAIIFSYFFFYEYSIISRNYAIGIFFMILFCVLYQNKFKNLIYIGITLFLMGQTNIYSFLISVFLFILVISDIIKSNKETKKDINKIFLIFFILLFLGEIIFLYWQLGGQAITGTTFSAPLTGIFQKSLQDYITSFRNASIGVIDSFLQTPPLSVNFWGHSFLAAKLLKINFIFKYLIAFLFLIIPIFVLKRKAFILFFSGSLFILLISIFVYSASLRHYGHIFILFLISIWISKTDLKDKPIFNFNSNYFFNIYLAIILTFSILGSSIAFYYDYKYPFTGGKAVSEYIESNFDLDNTIIMGYPGGRTQIISAYLNKDIYYPQSTSFKKLVIQDAKIKIPIDANSLFKIANSFIDKEKSIVLLIIPNSLSEPEKEQLRDFKKIDLDTQRIIFNPDNFWIYVFDEESFKKLTEGKLLFTTDYKNFNEYWLALNQSEFIFENNSIIVNVSGDDPWFESKFPLEFKNNLPLLFKIFINSPADGELRIFYGRENNEYTWEDSTGYLIHEGENTVFIKIPYAKNLKKVRIDPIDKNINCTIRKIEIYSLLNN